MVIGDIQIKGDFLSVPRPPVRGKVKIPTYESDTVGHSAGIEGLTHVVSPINAGLPPYDDDCHTGPGSRETSRVEIDA